MFGVGAGCRWSHARGSARTEYAPRNQYIDVTLSKHGTGRLDAPELIERIAKVAGVVRIERGRVKIGKAHERAMSAEATLHLRDHGIDAFAREDAEFVVRAGSQFADAFERF